MSLENVAQRRAAAEEFGARLVVPLFARLVQVFAGLGQGNGISRPPAPPYPPQRPARTTAHPAATAPHTNGPFHGRGTDPTPSSQAQATATAAHPTSPHSRTVHTSTERTRPTP